MGRLAAKYKTKDKLFIRRQDNTLIASFVVNAKHFRKLSKIQQCTLQYLKDYCTETDYKFPLTDYLFSNYYSPDEIVNIELRIYK